MFYKYTEKVSINQNMVPLGNIDFCMFATLSGVTVVRRAYDYDGGGSGS